MLIKAAEQHGVAAGLPEESQAPIPKAAHLCTKRSTSIMI
jgi:hypothetical protein